MAIKAKGSANYGPPCSYITEVTCNHAGYKTTFVLLIVSAGVVMQTVFR